MSIEATLIILIGSCIGGGIGVVLILLGAF